MLITWVVIFGILAALFGTLGYAGATHGWVLPAKVLFNVLVLASGLARWWAISSSGRIS